MVIQLTPKINKEGLLMNKKKSKLNFLLPTLLFGIIFITFMPFRLVSANDYPSGGGNWTIESNEDKTIDGVQIISGHIYNYGNLTIENAQITISSSSYQLWNYAGSRLTIRNSTFTGTSGGGLQILFSGLTCDIYNSTFKTLSSGGIISYSRSFNVSHTIFDGFSNDIITFVNYNHEVVNNINITHCTFKNTPNAYSINLEGSGYGYEENTNISFNIVNNAGGFKAINMRQTILNNNSFTQAKFKAIEWNTGENCEIQSNSFIQTPTCIQVFGCPFINISYNTLNLINNIGIDLTYSHTATISNNNITMTDGVGILDKSENEQRVWIRNTNITMASSTNDMEAISLGGSPYQTETPVRHTYVENSTIINGINIRSYYNLSDQIIDFAGQVISKFIAINCTNMVFLNLNVSEADGIFLSSLVNCTLYNLTTSNNFFSGITTELNYQLNITQFNCSKNRNIGFRDNSVGTYSQFPHHPSNHWNNYSYGIIMENGREGIHSSRENYLGLHNLTISKNAFCGIFLNQLENSTLTNITLIENGFHGIELNSGFNTTMQYCNFSKNTQNNLRVSNWSPASITKVYDSEFDKSSSGPFANIFSYDSSTEIKRNHYSDYMGFDDDNNHIGDIPYRADSPVEFHINDTEPFFDDADNDNIDRFKERLYNTNSLDADSDDDGLTDYQEIYLTRAFNQVDFSFTLSLTNPLVNDTDGDGLSDSVEMLTLKTNPNSADTDGDGFNDKEEVDSLSNPLDPLDWPGRSSQQYDYYQIEDKQKEAVAERSVQSIPGYSPTLIIILSIGIIFMIGRRKQQQLHNNSLHIIGGGKQ